MNMPYQACQFATYEAAKQALSSDGEEGSYNPLVNMLAGATAGGVAAGQSSPPLPPPPTHTTTSTPHSPSRYFEVAAALVASVAPRWASL